MVGRKARMDGADRTLWQRSRMIDAAEDECDCFLDLAAYADGRLDPDERERVAEWLRRRPEFAGDVAAARVLASGVRYEVPAEMLVARACAIIGDAASRRPDPVVAFRAGAGRRPVLGTIAQWGSLAAALVVAGWLGFTLGVDASGMLARNGPGIDDGVTQDLFGSAPAFFRDVTGGA